MKRPGSRSAPRTPLQKIRPFVLPVVAIVLIFTLSRDRYDVDDVRDFLRDGDVEQALQMLSRAGPTDLIEPLTTNLWMTAAQRSEILTRLRERPDEQRSESIDAPTILSPGASYRKAPTTLSLREPLDRPADVTLRGIELGLDMGTFEVHAGSTSVPIPIPLLAGMTVSVSLVVRDESQLPALGFFRVLDAELAGNVGIVLATAAELAGDDEQAAALLTGIVALDYNLADEAQQRLRPLLDDARFATVARELIAIALDVQGLDRSALAVLAAR